MNKHFNKYWLREKEYYSLKKYSWRIRAKNWNDHLFYDNTEEIEIEQKIEKIRYKKKYDFDGVPRYFRKYLNRKQRYKSKRDIRNILDGKLSKFTPCYKGAAYDYF